MQSSATLWKIWKTLFHAFSYQTRGWWAETLPKLIVYTVLKRQIKHRLWQAVTRTKNSKKNKQTQNYTIDNTKRVQRKNRIFCVPDFFCRYLGDTDMCTHICSPGHMRESAPKVEREGRGGGIGQSDISSWVPATVWKCHIIRPDTSIKVRKSFLTVDSKRIITSLHHPFVSGPSL